MGTTRHFNNARNAVERTRLMDAVAAARMGQVQQVGPVQPLPRDWPPLPSPKLPDRAGIERLLQRMNDDPAHPANWHSRAVTQQMRSLRVRDVYYRLRRALWLWPEFAGLCPGARSILESVIELAREEAFPWYVMVPARQVRAIARLSEKRFSTNVRELECLAISRPARMLDCDDLGPKLPMGKLWERDAQADDAPPMAQWVVRYRRGVPWNAKRAAWWINYDLLCETGRVLPCFTVSPANLSSTYQARNTPMGGIYAGFRSEDELAAMNRLLSQRGPLPPIGFRAALWGA